MPSGDHLACGAVVAGRYEVASLLGRGGFGAVYLAQDLFLERSVALKLLHAGAEDAEGRGRFLREARATAGLRHPNVVVLHDAGEDASGPYLVLEAVEGTPLSRIIAGGPLPVDRAIALGRQIAAALHAAHGLGIVHRDIKPDNVLVAEGDLVKVMDFGIARRRGDRQLTAEGIVLGTPDYMAPEQIEGRDVGPPADCFALGAVLFEMVAGRPPFSGTTTSEVVMRILSGRADPLPDGVPVPYRRVLECLLLRSPADRLTAGDAEAGLGPGGAEREPVTAALPRSTTRSPSLVVLPFTNLSPGADCDFICDGLADELITDLSSGGELRVISRTSAARLKGSPRDPEGIAADLGVRHVLEGSVKKWGDELRVTVSLLDTESGSHVWSRKLRGAMGDLFDIEESIARDVLAALAPAERGARPGASQPIPDARALEYYLRAKHLIYTFRREALDQAREYLERGVGIVGETAPLLAALSYLHWQYINCGISTDPAHIERATDYARRVLRLEPRSPDGHRMLGLCGTSSGMPIGQAMGYLKRALDLAPGDTDTLFWLVMFAGFTGRSSLGRPWAERLLELDPFTPIYSGMVGLFFMLEGAYERGAERFDAAFRSEPDNHIGAMYSGVCHVLAGRRDVAYARWDHLASVGAGSFFHRLAVILRAGLEGRRDDVQAGITPDVADAARVDYQYSWTLAQALAQTGCLTEAIDWLRNAMERGFINYPFLALQDPLLEPLRRDARFARLMSDVRHQWETFEIVEVDVRELEAR